MNAIDRLRMRLGELRSYEAAHDVIASSAWPQDDLDAAAVDDLYQAAKAAHDELDDAIKANVNDEWDQSDYDRWDAARTSLAAAVRRIEGTP